MPRNDRRKRHLRVPVTDEEAQHIEQRAEAAGLPLAAYLREVGAGRVPRATIDQHRVDLLVKAMGDLGRLGGLLKLWLSDDAKLAAYPAQRRHLIPEALQQILGNQSALREVIDGLRQ